MQFNWLGKTVTLQGAAETDWIYTLIKKTGAFYEIDLLQYIRYALKSRRGCILDIGANIGNHSVYFGMFVCDAVICFEPNPGVLPTLAANLSDNGIRHKLYRLGLGDRESAAVVDLPEADGDNVGKARLLECAAGASGSIRVATLDGLLPEIKAYLNGLAVVAAKIDVEGMEHLVLRGGAALLDEYKPDLFVEVVDRAQMENIESVLVPLGYKRIVSWAATPVWHFAHRQRRGPGRMLRLSAYIQLRRYAESLKRLV